MDRTNAKTAQARGLTGVDTLAILLILLAIGMIAYLAIPKLIRCGPNPNEMAAIGTLRNLIIVEEALREYDLDDNGVHDYWTADVYGLGRIRGKDGRPILDLIFPKSDRFARGASRLPEPVPKSGYFVEALTVDENGQAYAKEGHGNDRPSWNQKKFGFRTVPAIYGETGTNTFEVNEAGAIYGRDFGYGAESDRSPAGWEGGADPTKAGWRWVQ